MSIFGPLSMQASTSVSSTPLNIKSTITYPGLLQFFLAVVLLLLFVSFVRRWCLFNCNLGLFLFKRVQVLWILAWSRHLQIIWSNYLMTKRNTVQNLQYCLFFCSFYFVTISPVYVKKNTISLQFTHIINLTDTKM